MTGYRDRIYLSYGKNFQDSTETFDPNSSRRWGAARDWHLRDWLPKDKSASIVDLACGGGKLLHFFSDRGYMNITGVDISPDQVALSCQVVPNVIQGNVINFLEANSNQYDLITGFDIVEHFDKDEVLRFLDAAYNALKLGGRLILQTPNANSLWFGQYRYGDFTHEVGFTPNSIERLMGMVGFSSTTSRECDPAPFGYSIVSTIRALLWLIIRMFLLGYNLVETGNTQDRVLTRVFLATGRRSE